MFKFWNKTCYRGRKTNSIFWVIPLNKSNCIRSFSPGEFRKVATAMTAMIRNSAKTCWFTLDQLNRTFLELTTSHPVLVLQWCQVYVQPEDLNNQAAAIFDMFPVWAHMIIALIHNVYKRCQTVFPFQPRFGHTDL